MGKYVVDNCCFCVDLRVGCFIIGYLKLIVSGLATIGSVMIVAGGAVLAASRDEQKQHAGVIILVVGIITMLYIAMLLAFSIVLLVGLHKNKPGHVKAFIGYCYVFLVLSVIMLIVNLATGHYTGGAIASRVIGLLFSTYFVMVIRSYYYQMLEGSAGPTYCNS